MPWRSSDQSSSAFPQRAEHARAVPGTKVPAYMDDRRAAHCPAPLRPQDGGDDPGRVTAPTARVSVHRLTGLVLAAVAAPSVHNTQPWIFATRPGQMSMRADRRRQLTVLDPTGRQLVLSCGCALFNFRVAAAVAGFVTRVERFPQTDDPDLLARVDVQVDPAGADTDLAAL